MERVPTATPQVGQRQTRRARPPLTVLALAVLAVLTAGCTPTPAPTPTDSGTRPVSSTVATTPTASSSPSGTSPAATDPGIPTAARANTLEGAQEFVKYYVERINDASRTPDPTLLDPLTGPACPACAALRRAIADDQAAGRRVDGDIWAVQYAITSAFGNDGTATVLLKITENRVPVLRADGTIDHYIEAEVVEFVVSLTFDQTWRVTRLQGAPK